MNQNIKLQRKGNFKSSDRQSTHHKSVDHGQYPYETNVASVWLFRKSWSFVLNSFLGIVEQASIITNLPAEFTKLHNCKCCALRGSLNLMAPNFELCCLSLLQFYRKSHDTFFSLTKDSPYVFPSSSAHFGMPFAFFYFESGETNRTKIPRKVWCARLQIGVEGVKED